jgi:hypothetical protein
MGGILQVDTIQNNNTSNLITQTNVTTITIGASGQTISIPAGATLNTTTLVLAAGAVGTPSLTTSGDTNTGIFFPSADTIAFTEGGTEAMRIDSSGNVLIGTTTTGSKGISLSADFNIGYAQGTGESVPNIFRQTSSAATVIGNGIRHSTTANGFASSYSPSWAKTAIALNEGTIRFFSDGATTVAAGTDITPTERMRIDSNGNLQFNSGYGSVATAFGCRAWVNFNGTGTVAIRASGNVTSITDNGTGDYTVNFTTAMPDENYACIGTSNLATGFTFVVAPGQAGSPFTGTKTTSALRITTQVTGAGGAQDPSQVSISILR